MAFFTPVLGPLTGVRDGAIGSIAELDAERSRRLGELIERRAAAGSQVIAAVPQAGELPGGAGTALGALPRRAIAEGHVT